MNPVGRPKIFFGWWVVFASCFGMLLGSYSTFVGVSFALFVKPLEASFGWSRTEISLALTICTYVIVFVAPVIGSMIDRHGARKVLLISMALLGFAVGALSFLDGSLWQLYGLFFLIALAGSGTIPTTFSRTILNWFDRQRGLALGIALSGIGVAGILLPPLIQHLISTFGWSTTYLIMGATVLLVAWPVVFLLFRDHPASMGLLADGSRIEEAHPGTESGSVSGFAFRESLSTTEFWIIGLSILLLGLGGTGVIIHLPAMMTDRGLSPAQAALTFSIYGATVIIGRISCGWFIDRFFAPRVAVFFLLGPVLGIAILLFTDGTVWLPLAGILIGLGLGAEFDLLSYFISRYLGLKAYGKIYGLMYSAFSIGAGLGPLIMGLSYDQLGSYNTGVWVLFFAVCIAVLLISRLGEYRFGPETQSN